jgi:hypothetical protein
MYRYPVLYGIDTRVEKPVGIKRTQILLNTLTKAKILSHIRIFQ